MKLQPWSHRELHKAASKAVAFTEVGTASQESTCYRLGRNENRVPRAATVAPDRRMSYCTDSTQQRRFTERTHERPEKRCGVSYPNTDDSATQQSQATAGADNDTLQCRAGDCQLYSFRREKNIRN